MSTRLDDVRREIVELHAFFVAWFHGAVARDQLEPRFLSRLDKDLMFIPPGGQMTGVGGLKAMFENGYGSNTGFNIQIRDVALRWEAGDTVLATYTEWQIGALTSQPANNARVTSALLKMGPPIKWLHIHETWLPEALRAADPFDF